MRGEDAWFTAAGHVALRLAASALDACSATNDAAEAEQQGERRNVGGGGGGFVTLEIRYEGIILKCKIPRKKN